jgi:cation diffusion facilitator CzcD-associated flavoprotein CzcO
VPDGDLFAAIRSGQARVVTGRIARIERDGISLENGERLAADVIVKATGLKLAVAGKIALRRDGVAINLADHLHYKDCMLSNLPNLVQVFGYLNASWTLRADLVAAFTTRVLNHMAQTGAQVATPVLPPTMAWRSTRRRPFRRAICCAASIFCRAAARSGAGG